MANKKFNKSKFHCGVKKGFTLIEMLVVIAIIAIISSIVFISLSDFKKNQSLDSSVFNTKSLIDQARSNTISSKGDSQYGVHFQGDRAVMFKGSSYSSTDVNNVTNLVDQNTTISSINLNGGGTDVVFDRLTGITPNNGTITFSLSNSASTKTVTIFSSGLTQ